MLLRILLVASLASSAFAGSIANVSHSPVVVHADFQSAIDAAQEGDVLLAHGGTYSGFTIDGRSISIFAVPGEHVSVQGAVVIEQVSSSQSVLLSGLDVNGGLGAFFDGNPAVSVDACAGPIRVQDCTLTGGLGRPADSHNEIDGGSGGAGARVVNSSSVTIQACTLQGGVGGWTSQPTCFPCIGAGGGGFGLDFGGNARVALYDCVALGGKGGSGGFIPGPGGSGIRSSSTNAVLFASNSSAIGGNAGPGSSGANGGAGLGVPSSATVATVLDCTFLGGNASSGGEPGAPISGSVMQLAASARTLTTPRVVRDATAITATFGGNDGDRCFAPSSLSTGWLLKLVFNGVWTIPYPAKVSKTPSTVIGPSGSAIGGWITPDVGNGAQARVQFRQGLVLPANGGAVLASPACVLVLDTQALPDCNANGVFDVVDVLEGAQDCNSDFVPDACDIQSGTSSDCNGNSVPDECDIAEGLEPDCDANGVPDACQRLIDCNQNGQFDACDIQNGTSHDSNGNGLPDECETTGTIWWVDASAPPGGDGTSTAPFQSISAGISIALSGDTVMVRDGVYTGGANRQLDFTGRNIVVRSENGHASCVIDCQGLGRAFYLHSGETSPARIEGFTIRNGVSGAPGVAGGGGVLLFGASPDLVDCRFEFCSAAGQGGGVYVSDPQGGAIHIDRCAFVGPSVSATGYGGGLYAQSADFSGYLHVSRSSFENCSATRGGAIASHSIILRVSHCTFLSNSAIVGGAVYVRGFTGQFSLVDQCLFAGNRAVTAAGFGGALASDDSSGFPCPILARSSTFASNSSSGAGGAIGLENHSTNALSNCVFWGGSSALGQGHEIALFADFLVGTTLGVSYCDVAGGSAGVYRNSTTFTTLNWGAGNQSSDPMFVDPDGADGDPLTFADNVYRLKPNSPCLDAGNNAGVSNDFNDIDGDGDTAEPTPFDIQGKPRFGDMPLVPDTGSGSPPLVDLGCHERQG